MQTARDIMTANVITVTPETEIVQAARMLLDNRINGLPVVDAKGRLVGIVCQSDLIVQQKRVRVPSLFTFLAEIIGGARNFCVDASFRIVTDRVTIQTTMVKECRAVRVIAWTGFV